MDCFIDFSLTNTNLCPAEAAGSCLGELGPVDFSTIALLHGRDALYEKAVSLFTPTESQCLYIILNCMNDALTHQRYGKTSSKGLTRGAEWFVLIFTVCAVVCLPVLR